MTAVSRTAPWDVAIVGAGYVGLPLAATFADAGQRVLLLDVVPELVEAINAGRSHIEDVPSDRLEPHVRRGRITRPRDYEDMKQAHAILIALPTPLTKQREPDLSYVEQAARDRAPCSSPASSSCSSRRPTRARRARS